MANTAASRTALLNLRGNLKFAGRGIDLLKAKRTAIADELAKTRKALQTMESDLEPLRKRAIQSFVTAYAVDGRSVFDLVRSALPGQMILELTPKNIFGVRIPVLDDVVPPGELPFNTASISTRIATARSEFMDFIVPYIRYAFLMARERLLDAELRKTTRRMNFLTHSLVPKIRREIFRIDLVLEDRAMEETVRRKSLKRKKNVK